MNVAALFFFTILSLTGTFNTDIFVHKNGVNHYNVKFECKNIKPVDHITIKIKTSININHHKYIFPVKNVRLFSAYGDEIADSTVRTIDSTLIYVSKKPDIVRFTLSYYTYNSVIFTGDSAMIFPFNFHVYPPMYTKTDIYMPENLPFSMIHRNNLTVNRRFVEYSGSNFNTLSNLHIAFGKKYMEKHKYSLIPFYFSMFWSYSIPLLLIIFIFLYVNAGKYRKIDYVPDVVLYSPPKNLSPEEINFLLHNTLNLNGMVAMIFNIAEKGYISIIREKSASPFSKADFKIIRNKKHYGEDINEYEKEILNTLFPFPEDSQTYISDKSEVLKKKYIEIIGDLSDHMAKQGFYMKDPMVKRTIIVFFGVSLMIIGTIILFFNSGQMHSIPFYQHHVAFSVILSGIIIALSNGFYNFRTKFGNYTLAEIKGFSEYFFRVDMEKITFSTENYLTDFYATFASAMDYKNKFLSEFKYYLSDRYKEKDGSISSEEILNENINIKL